MTEDSYEQHFEAEPETPEPEADEPEVEEEKIEEEVVEEEPQEEPETETEDFEAEPETETEETTEDSEDDDEDFDKPVSEGDEVEIEVEDLGSKGDGIARKEGFVIFVPGGEVGETYMVEVTSVGRKFAFGEIIE